MIRILIADDHAMVRQGLKQLLNSASDMFVAGLASDGLEAVDLCAQLQPDIVLMDIGMPKMDGVSATQIICQRNPNIKVIVLSLSTDEAVLQKARSVGAKEILSKNGTVSEILETIRSVYRP